MTNAAVNTYTVKVKTSVFLYNLPIAPSSGDTFN